MADTNAAFATWLRKARAEAGLSQQKVADALRSQGYTHLHQSNLAKIERGERPVRLAEAVAMAELFGTTIDVALGLKADAPQGPTAQALARRASALQRIQRLVEAELGGGS